MNTFREFENINLSEKLFDKTESYAYWLSRYIATEVSIDLNDSIKRFALANYFLSNDIIFINKADAYIKPRPRYYNI